MGRNRFVQPESKRIDLSDGDWIEVKKELTIGEEKTLQACGIKRTLTAPPSVDWPEYHIGRVAVWLTGWSFRGPDDKPVPLSVAAIRSLDAETFGEITDALTKHRQELDDAKKAKKLATTT